MNVNVIGVVGYHAMYGIRSIDGSVAGNRFADEISKAAARLETVEPDSGKAITKLRHEGDGVGETSELEDKYCSLCGSMIKEDGSCPMCGVPYIHIGQRAVWQSKNCTGGKFSSSIWKSQNSGSVRQH